MSTGSRTVTGNPRAHRDRTCEPAAPRRVEDENWRSRTRRHLPPEARRGGPHVQDESRRRSTAAKKPRQRQKSPAWGAGPASLPWSATSRRWLQVTVSPGPETGGMIWSSSALRLPRKSSTEFATPESGRDVQQRKIDRGIPHEEGYAATSWIGRAGGRDWTSPAGKKARRTPHASIGLVVSSAIRTGSQAVIVLGLATPRCRCALAALGGDDSF